MKVVSSWSVDLFVFLALFTGFAEDKGLAVADLAVSG